MKSDLKRIPLIRILIPFALGIALEAEFKWDNIAIFSLLILICFIGWMITILTKVFRNYSKRHIAGLFILPLYILLGIFYTSLRFENKKKTYFQKIIKENDQCLLEIESPLIEKTKSIKTYANVVAVGQASQWTKTTGRLLIYLQKDSIANGLQIGDQIVINRTPNNLQSPKNPDEFNYKKYLINHQIYQQLFLKKAEWKKTKYIAKNSLKKVANTYRNKLLSKLKLHGITGDEYAVISALVFGNKDSLDKDLFRSYASAGAMHVLAVSGLHVGLIFVIINHLLFFLNRNKRLKIIKAIIIILFLWSYALLTGMSASVFRAVTMFSFIVLGGLINRRTSIYNTLAASAFVLLLFNPFIINEVGFQLSYLAVIGIVYLQPKIYKSIYIKNPLLDKVWSLTAVSLSAQIATFPLGLLYFHQFPSYFLISNLFVIPAATIILYLAFIFVMVSWQPMLAELIAKALHWITYWLNHTIALMQELPYNQIKGIVITILEVYLLYFLIISIVTWLVKKQKNAIWISFVLIGLLTSSWIQKDNSRISQEELLFYSINGETAISITQRNTCHFISSEKFYKNKDKTTFHVLNHMNSLGTPKVIFHNIDSLTNYENEFLFINSSLIKAFDKSIYVQSKNNRLVNGNLKVDYLLLRNNKVKKASKLVKLIDAKTIILSGSIYKNNRKKIRANIDSTIQIIDVGERHFSINKFN